MKSAGQMMRHIVRAVALLAVTMTPVAMSASAEKTAPTGEPGHVEMTDDGPILVTSNGRTLYVFGAGDNRVFGYDFDGHCTNVPVRRINDLAGGFGTIPVIAADRAKSCADKNPPYMADAQAKPIGDWTLVDGPAGGKQWAYKGKPVFMSIKDTRPGDRNRGSGFARDMDILRFPPGFDLTMVDEDLVLSTTRGGHKILYTPKGGGHGACADCADLFAPLTAPAVAHVSGDWSIVQSAPGQMQYAYKGKLLYTARDDLTIWDVDQKGGWDRIVFHKGAPPPREINKQLTLAGEVYTDKAGLTLYQFQCHGNGGATCDDPGDPARYWVVLCSTGDTCAKRWHPYVASPGARPSGNWTIVTISNPAFNDPDGGTYPPDMPRVKVWAYRGKPVYTYYLDRKPGDFAGHVVRVTGDLSLFIALRVPGRAVAGSIY